MRFQVIVNAIRWSSATKLATTRGLSVLAASAFGSASASSFRYSDVRSVPVYQPVVESKEKNIIAKSVVTSNASKSERGLFIQWVKEKSLGLLGMFAKATNKTGSSEYDSNQVVLWNTNEQ